MIAVLVRAIVARTRLGERVSIPRALTFRAGTITHRWSYLIALQDQVLDRAVTLTGRLETQNLEHDTSNCWLCHKPYASQSVCRHPFALRA